MSKASKIVVLCEDKAHEVFVCRFLKSGWKVQPRDIRVPEYPRGKGSGKKHVEDAIGKEAKALRKRQASTILLVVRDADENSLDDVTTILDAKIQPPREKKDQIMYIIPKWHLETWVAYLDDVEVDESDKITYKHKYKSICESKIVHQFVDKLAGDCKGKNNLKSPPDSLVAACNEFERIRGALTGN
ncbi:MAG: hypothetical protein P9L92_20715 [Candidatus Electryonea clarkiae]|nr:hypothetical protein [Candidatus Electryonea clarkiae]MDP8285945.1 hypothetical protein [Candidatus Electryonea clarkiae]